MLTALRLLLLAENAREALAAAVRMRRGGAHIMSGMLPDDIRGRVIDNLPTPTEPTTEIQEAGDALGEAGASGLELFEDETAN